MLEVKEGNWAGKGNAGDLWGALLGSGGAWVGGAAERCDDEVGTLASLGGGTLKTT